MGQKGLIEACYFRFRNKYRSKRFTCFSEKVLMAKKIFLALVELNDQIRYHTVLLRQLIGSKLILHIQTEDDLLRNEVILILCCCPVCV